MKSNLNEQLAWLSQNQRDALEACFSYSTTSKQQQRPTSLQRIATCQEPVLDEDPADFIDLDADDDDAFLSSLDVDAMVKCSSAVLSCSALCFSESSTPLNALDQPAPRGEPAPDQNSKEPIIQNKSPGKKRLYDSQRTDSPRDGCSLFSFFLVLFV